VNNLKNRKGFTLIEIIVVLIIIGVLVAMALPGLFAQIARQRVQEAMNTMNMMRSAMESCGISNNYDFATCDWTTISMSDPSYNTPAGSNMGSKFTYTWSALGSNTYTMTATSTGDVNNWIKEVRDNNGMTCTANGIYGGMC
jgi:prepilin-type N-terminal cleavage/methylation domain-containing protein